ncbi:hypothetical protein B0H19DRAFT_1274298 [Mycena capillaripes]|nr:hypothetical protein B0H19DRAFT_1274298 [Mycena capillaripes]
MPIYTLTASDDVLTNSEPSKMKAFSEALAALHAKTFHSDPAAVQVDFDHKRYSYGGYGQGMFRAHLVAQVVWTGTREEWQEYCRKIVKLWGPMLRTIVLQRVEWEFEVVEDGRQVNMRIEPGLGRIVGHDFEEVQT